MAEDFRESLYTIDTRGKRKWVYWSIVKGFYFRPRAVVAYTLMSIYLLLPWIEIGGKQGVRLDLAARKFTFFGTDFWATDSIFLFLVLSSAVHSFPTRRSSDDRKSVV